MSAGNKDDLNKQLEEIPLKESLLFRLWKKTKARLLRDDVPEPLSVEPPKPDADEEQAPSDDRIYILWKRWLSADGKDPKDFLYSPMADVRPEAGEGDASSAELETRGLRQFEEQTRQMAELMYSALEEGEEGINGRICTGASTDRMTVWAMMFPPYGGRELTVEDIGYELHRRGIVYGVDSDEVARMAAGELYFRARIAARGIRPVDGENGELIDCVSPKEQTQVTENVDGTVDYKNMNTFQNVKKGTVLCQITPPTEGTDGIDVRGTKVPCSPGIPARLPRSPNTELSPDGTRLISSIDGHLTVQNNKFIVEQLLVIDGDVDISVGNLDFPGDIVVNGDVREGFEVRAKGNITISGMVESTVVAAGDSIVIGKGMNGNSKGWMEAKNDITCRYIENCTVYAGGTISTESIICSDIACDDTVSVEQGRGVIIGGSCTAQHLIRAKRIGSQSQRITNIILGNTPAMLLKKQEAEETLHSIRIELEGIERDLRYLQTGDQELSKERTEKLNRMKLKRPALRLREDRTAKYLDELCDRMADTKACRVQCEEIYPPTQIMIGEAVLSIEKLERNCNIYCADGQVMIGSLV